MPTNHLTLSNFKAFGPVAQAVPLKPITLIFGPNSAGKSSILHALLWLRHGLNQGNLDVQQPDRRQGIDLGGFDQLIHRHDPGNTPVVGWSIPGRSIEAGLGGWENLERFDIELGCNRRPSEVALQTCAISTPHGLMFRASLRSQGGWKIDTLDWEHPALRSLLAAAGINSDDQSAARRDRMDQAIFAGLYDLKIRNFVPTNLVFNPSADIHEVDRWLLTEAIPGAFAKLFDAFRVEIDARIQKMIFVPPLREVPARSTDFRHGGSGHWHRLMMHPERESILRTLNAKLVAMKIPYEVHLRRLVPEDAFIDRVEEKLLEWVTEAVAHSEINIEPGEYRFKSHFSHRAYWEGLSGPLRDRSEYWAGEGWEAMEDRYEWIYEHPEFHEMLIDYWEDTIKGNPHHFPEAFDDYEEQHPEGAYPPDEWIRKYADDLIGDTDQVHEELRTRILLAEDPELRAAISAGLDAKRLAGSLRSATDMLGSRMEVRLRDLQHGVWVSLQDVGVGISQVMPVLMEAMIGDGSLIAIEQPELHIHPRLQAELGDLFIESALGGNKNTFLIETHSEHLILRILRRIRETTRGKLPDGLEPVRPEDVAVLFVEPSEEGSKVREIKIDEQGRIRSAWPEGFFEERLEELF
ncbi:MAG: DUF3696 domain-containing protein [Verrucomicrobia bacterium]|nr:DUF3696 domain-containing protein [Verrucomicrobiota bacterium]